MSVKVASGRLHFSANVASSSAIVEGRVVLKAVHRRKQLPTGWTGKLLLLAGVGGVGGVLLGRVGGVGGIRPGPIACTTNKIFKKVGYNNILYII